VEVDGSSNPATGNAIEAQHFQQRHPGIFLTNGGNDAATEPPP